MNNDVELEGRPRPLSTGLWTLFSWLRRDDRTDSSDSLSSAGSDRTVASFAFLTPAHYFPATTPFVLPSPGPPTDSYKKRLHDRNLRRQYDRDITLHRKYGLFKSGEATCGYDAFSLPPARRISLEVDGRRDRDRRATSECYQRRIAHVPGKRRAPLPPVPVVSTTTTTTTTSLIRRSTRKRRAPQPPVKLIEKDKENIKNVSIKATDTPMNPQSEKEKQKLRNNDVSMGCKSEKYIKKEGCIKDIKVKTEKNFLKQIFDSKKRNSGIDISSVKLLPSISELDKQAAEIIKNCKINGSEQNNNVNDILGQNYSQLSRQSDTWICVGCLRKYNSSLITCLYCLPKQELNPHERTNDDIPSGSKASDGCTQTEKNLTNFAPKSNSSATEDKQKLKEMLKEMKDSLPKRPKHDINSKTVSKNIVAVKTSCIGPYSMETPTLRVGYTVQNEINVASESQPAPTSIISKSALPPAISTTHKPQVAIQLASPVPVMTNFWKQNESDTGLEKTDANTSNIKYVNLATSIKKATDTKVLHIDVTDRLKNKNDLHTPLKISSLLNPVYIPKTTGTNQPLITNIQAVSNTEKQTIIVPKVDDIKKIPNDRIKRTTDPTPGPSTSKINQMPVKVETKSTIEVQTTTEPLVILQKHNSAGAKKENNLLKSKGDKALMPLLSTKEINLPRDMNAQNQHSRRRDLIHQLEQSIARGDESAAAEAAAKLAQLRLSCSVLSFSSQILSKPSTSAATTNVMAVKVDTNKVIAKNNTPEEKIKKESQPMQLSTDKERSPQKVVASNLTSTTNVVKTNTTISSAGNTEPLKDKFQLNNQEPLLKKNILDNKKENSATQNDTLITIAVLVEDREATRGPIQLRIRRQALMRDLRREAETSLGLATNLQRWIVGRVLCVNDNIPIMTLAGHDFSAPFYLCVVESETKSDSISSLKAGSSTYAKCVPTTNTKIILNNNKIQPQGKTDSNVYTELVQLEQQALVPNTEHFECGVCMEKYLPGRGVVLRDCVHIFCKGCLADVVRHCEEPDIPCPAMGCRGMLQEREIRALVTPQDYERWLARGLAAAESGTRNAFHCRTRDCKGWALCEPGVQRFPCPVCKHINCVLCQAIHEGETCEQHRCKVKETAAGKSAKVGETDDGTRTLLSSLIAKGEALQCPECSAVITKKWGCDWVKCSACKTEICWVTRGRRWGPGGKGDISGGCRCGVDGKRCHPSCGYCH